MTDSQANYDAVTIGHDLGTLEMVLDAATVTERMSLVRWQDGEPVERGLAPPGITISQHSRMKFDALPLMRVSIWTKSEHEFLKPIKIGDKVTIRGRVVDKYAKRGRNYLVTEFETRGEAGEVLMRSRETGVRAGQPGGCRRSQEASDGEGDLTGETGRRDPDARQDRLHADRS